MHALSEQLPPVLVGDLLAQDVLRALRGQLPRVFGELMACVFDSVVDIASRRLKNLLCFRPRRGDHLFFLALPFRFGAFQNGPQVTVQPGQP